jgi:type III restriction enzyme
MLYARDENGSSRYLREPQIRALETYWYLRLVEDTPHVAELYERLFPLVADRLTALGLDHPAIKDLALNEGYAGLLGRIQTDDSFVRQHRLEGLRETLNLGYPSWILALAMGAGKTILIGAIVATEFAMALEYPDAASPFIENALVFAPGKTIIESLRELASTRYELLLPPRLYGPFAASLKLTFTRDGERDVAVTRASRFNLVVTNTEKIAIRAKPVRGNLGFLQLQARLEEAEAIANLRLQSIASLPHLGVFSDEAHHTYGQSLGTDLKRVRQTVDYLAQSTNVIAVINTTGTPYFQRQPLKDVVIWYGLAQGIGDGILKEVADNIYDYEFDDANTDEFVAEVVRDFFATYGDHHLPDGSPARLAIYFPQTDDLAQLRPHVELAVSLAGFSPTTTLVNTSLSTTDEVDAFNRLNDPASPHRVILLVNKGTEGWNCPSLFATALARRLKTSNNFVLQAASRCLRQVPGNARPARIYLSSVNRGILDTQLRETYGESLTDLNHRRRESASATIRVRKHNLPPMRVTRTRRELIRRGAPSAELSFMRPEAHPGTGLTRTVFDVGISAASRRVLQQVGDALTLDVGVDLLDPYLSAIELAAIYRVHHWPVLDALRMAYGVEGIPVADLEPLARQLEDQLGSYRAVEYDEPDDLALLKPEGFDEVTDADGSRHRQATITYPADRSNLIWPSDRIAENAADYGFHYVPYNFDSNPESDFFEQVVRELNLVRNDVADVYFTGAITDPRKTDLTFSYSTVDGRTHTYTPDFAIRTTDDRWLLVEVKMAARRGDAVEGENGSKARALKELEARNQGKIGYRMVFTASDTVARTDVAAIRAFADQHSDAS